MQIRVPSGEVVWLTMAAPKASKGQGVDFRRDRASMAVRIQRERIWGEIGSGGSWVVRTREGRSERRGRMCFMLGFAVWQVLKV